MGSLQILEYQNQLFISQRVKPIELLTSYVAETAYDIRNERSAMLLTALEVSDPTDRQHGGPDRDLHVRFYDSVGNEVFHVDRPEAKYGCPCFSAMNERAMDVYAYPNQLIGYIEQVSKCFSTKWNVYNHQGDVVQHIEGDCNTYQVMSKTGERVARISKQVTNDGRATLTTADNYSVTYMCPLSVTQKAVLLAAAFFIDFSSREFRPPRDVIRPCHVAGGLHYQYNNDCNLNLSPDMKYGGYCRFDPNMSFYDRQIEHERMMNEANRGRALSGNFLTQQRY